MNAISQHNRGNETASNHRHNTNDERFDRISPAWRRFWSEHCWPAWRLERCSLDELHRLRKAVPYLLEALDRSIARKEETAR
jgi:CHAD domain-containing protein